MNIKKIKTLGLVSLIFFIGFVVGLASFFSQQNVATDGLQKKYSLLSKRVLIENPNDTLLDFRPLKQDISYYIDTNVGSDRISFYFEYLPTGSSIGVNEDNEVIGASLLKLPVVIKIYKYAEEGKIDLNEEVALKKEWLNNGYGQLYKKGPQYKLTIREATNYAIEQSDNTALLLLFDKITKIRIFPVVSATGFRFGRETEGNLRFHSDAAILMVCQSPKATIARTTPITTSYFP